MSQIFHPQQQFINVSSGVEVARQMSQEPLIVQAMGGLFVEAPDLSQVESILDLYCGPGYWALEMAFYYPQVEIIAIDSNRYMIEYARAQARVQGLDNITFLVGEPGQALPFSSASFDIVNSRFISAFLKAETWPAAVRECARVMRPGGILRLLESDSLWVSSSAACEQLTRLYNNTLQQHGLYLHPFRGCSQSTVSPKLGTFLHAAGLQRIQEKSYTLNCGGSTAYSYLKNENLKVLYKMGQPYLIENEVATQQELDILYETMLSDMLISDFFSLWHFLSCWGYKPAE